MEKRAFLVLGPESSGTKLFTEILIKAGCDGHNGNVQRWDTELPAGDLIVWRRSVPHGLDDYPDICAMVEKLRGLDYEVFAYVTTRDWTSILNSRVLQGGIQSYELAAERIQWPYPHIFSQLQQADVPFVMVSYEAVTEYGEKSIQRLLKIFGLELPELPEIYTGNEKYYTGDFVDTRLAELGMEKPFWL
jgi:hypothetical protein